MTWDQTKVEQGGLMRCCLYSLGQFVEEHSKEEATEGFTLDCIYEKPGNKNLIFQGGVWKWNQPDLMDG